MKFPALKSETPECEHFEIRKVRAARLATAKGNALLKARHNNKTWGKNLLIANAAKGQIDRDGGEGPETKRDFECLNSINSPPKAALKRKSNSGFDRSIRL